MNTLKNIKFSALALVLGLGLVFTQSAFTPAKSLNNVYGYDYTNGVWTLVGTAGYRCISNPEPCNYDFGTGAPTPGQTPGEVDAIPSETDFGSYEAL